MPILHTEKLKPLVSNSVGLVSIQLALSLQLTFNIFYISKTLNAILACILKSRLNI